MDLKEQNEQLKSALTRLVDLKDYKDKFGKDDFYLANQPETWEFARTTLKSVGVKVQDTESKCSLQSVSGSAYKCAICGKPITMYEVCEDCAKTNNCFDIYADNHEYKSGTKEI